MRKERANPSPGLRTWAGGGVQTAKCRCPQCSHPALPQGMQFAGWVPRSSHAIIAAGVPPGTPAAQHGATH
eukprot:1180460-Prorocentrum_minimum.AAC.1